MNKKVLFFLPLAALLLTGCGTTDNSSKVVIDDEEEEVVPPFDAAIYGTEDSPLTVAQLLTNANANIKKEEGRFSYYKFWVSGIVDANAQYNSGKGNWDIFYLKDNLSTNQGIKVIYAISPSLSLGTTLCQNDRVTLSGFLEYYNGIYSFYKKANTDPEISVATRGTSTFTIDNKAPSIITVTESFQESYVNLTNLTMHASSNNADYAVVVKVNDSIITGTDGAYSISVKGNTKVELNIDYTGPRADLPAGEYDPLRIDEKNCQLSVSVGTADTNVEYSIKEDDPEHDAYYKRANVCFSKEVHKNSNASYHEIDFNAQGKTIITLPNGKITKVKVQFYQDKNMKIFAGTSTEDDSNAISFVDDSTHHIKDNNKYLKIWDVPTDKQGKSVTVFNNMTGTTVSIYYIEIEFVVD